MSDLAGQVVVFDPEMFGGAARYQSGNIDRVDEHIFQHQLGKQCIFTGQPLARDTEATQRIRKKFGAWATVTNRLNHKS